MSNWFGPRNIAGYSHILMRVDWVYRERETLTRQEIDYEIRIIKRLLGEIPNEDTRRIWEDKVMRFLK